MKQLAIKGHETRGKEVIELLKMMGGKNYVNHSGNRNVLYFIHNSGEILADFVCLGSNYFTLEEFEEKYPYKLGDKVEWIIDNNVYEIESMVWDKKKEQVLYVIGTEEVLAHVYINELRPYKKETMEEDSILNQLIEYFKNTPRDIIEKEWHKYDKYNEIGPTVKEYLESINKPKYPKTYEECCGILGMTYDYPDIKMVSIDECSLYSSFIELIRCRDAYWKIAGEQMGLGKSWEPDWKDEIEFYYTIKYNGVNIRCYNYTDVYSKLVFPTAEMRDIFYENFKELIEKCKELL